ncbi:MAG: O-antigen ligase family protein, partial [Methanococcaceae archaeon]
PVVLWKYSKSASLYAKLFTVFIFLILGTLHFMTGSRTSLFVTIAGLAVWFVARREILKTGLLIASSAIIIFLLLQFKPQGFQREEGKGLMDLTGREDFWEGAQTLISEKPISGYGYAVEGKVWEDARFYNVKNSLWQGSSRASLHNGYISVAIGVGLISFILWCTILIIPLWRGLFLSADNYKALFISIIMMLLLTNFVETAISGGNSIESIFFWIIWVMLSKAPKINFRNTV